MIKVYSITMACVMSSLLLMPFLMEVLEIHLNKLKGVHYLAMVELVWTIRIVDGIVSRVS